MPRSGALWRSPKESQCAARRVPPASTGFPQSSAIAARRHREYADVSASSDHPKWGFLASPEKKFRLRSSKRSDINSFCRSGPKRGFPKARKTESIPRHSTKPSGCRGLPRECAKDQHHWTAIVSLAHTAGSSTAETAIVIARVGRIQFNTRRKRVFSRQVALDEIRLFQHPQWIKEKAETMSMLDRSVAIRHLLSQSVDTSRGVGQYFP